MDALPEGDVGNRGHYDHYGWIRRTDLSLRSHYPHLETRIFEIQRNRYVITFDRDVLDAAAVAAEFANNIRFITVNADVSNEIPATYLREIPTLADDEIAQGYAGMPFSLPQLSNLIAARFPNLPICALRDGGSPMTVTVELSCEISASDQEKLLAFCNGLKAPAPWQVVIVDAPAANPAPAVRDARLPPTIDNDPLGIRATRRRPYLPEFARRDEAFWFENLDNIFAGGMPVEAFPGIQQNRSPCFLDLSVGEHINLRQALLLYDTVYCSPPLLEEHDAFLKKQALSDTDLLHLVEVGRLKIVSTQAEERLNLKFLEAAAERNSTAIIGRRTTAAALIADIVQTSDEYQLAKPTLRRGVTEIAKLFSEHTNLSPEEILHLLMWPIEARRKALLPLLDRGSKGIAAIGLAPFIARQYKTRTGTDIELEALVVSERVHLGHALNATVFAGRHEPTGLTALMNIMGDALNFYRSFNTRIAASWVGNEERKAAGKFAMPSFPLFEFEPNIPLEEFLEDVRLPSTRSKGRALFGRLAELSEDERTAEIKKLETELRKRLRASGSVISFETLDTATACGSLIFGFPYPPVAGVRDLGKQLAEKARKIPSIDRLLSSIEQDLFHTFGKNQEIDFLSRVNRVATLKKQRVS